jgi:hypothetical protein
MPTPVSSEADRETTRHLLRQDVAPESYRYQTATLSSAFAPRHPDSRYRSTTAYLHRPKAAASRELPGLSLRSPVGALFVRVGRHRLNSELGPSQR